MKEKKQWLIRLFIILFSVSVSVAVLPCGIINTHGLFGEITSSTITSDDDNSSFQESRVFENRKQIKGINIYNIWFEVLICVICMIYIFNICLDFLEKIPSLLLKYEWTIDSFCKYIKQKGE